MFFLIWIVLSIGVGTAEAAAPARAVPYDEASLCVSSSVFFCEDFEGNDISVQPFGPCPWGNPAIRNKTGTTPGNLDCNNQGGGTAFGGTLQHPTINLPVGSDTTSNNQVWRVAKGGTSFQDIRTGIDTGFGHGTLRGFLRDTQGGGSVISANITCGINIIILQTLIFQNLSTRNKCLPNLETLLITLAQITKMEPTLMSVAPVVYHLDRLRDNVGSICEEATILKVIPASTMPVQMHCHLGRYCLGKVSSGIQIPGIRLNFG